MKLSAEMILHGLLQDVLVEPAEHSNEVPPEKAGTTGQQHGLAGETMRVGAEARDDHRHVVSRRVGQN